MTWRWSSVVSADVAYAATLDKGTAAIAYFIEGKSIDEAKAAYDHTRLKGEREYSSADAPLRSDSTEDRRDERSR
jgi:hypothetical protein